LWSLNGELVISDTPGSNGLKDKFEHNVWIATAFNFRPISKVFIVVKADVGRIDGVIDAICEYSDRFVDLPDLPLGVIITHMDTIQWSPSDRGHAFDIKNYVNEDAGIDDVVFSSPDITGESLIGNLLQTCKDKFDLRVDHENFLKLFTHLQKRNPKAREILRQCKKEVEGFIATIKRFNSERKKYPRERQVDLVFEFQAFMTQEITRAQKRLSEHLKFTFVGPEADNEAAHISNMSNQIIGELRKLRVEGLSYQTNHGVSVVRKCPHCGQAWTKVEGCEGETICGPFFRHSAANDTSHGVMATFSFVWDAASENLTITKTGTKSAKQQTVGSVYGIGCGKPITWRDMASIEVPAEFDATVTTLAMTDVAVLPPMASNFNEKLDDRLGANLKQLSLKPRPQNVLIV